MGVAWYKEVPDDQKMRYSVTPVPGSMIRAKMLGGQLRALARLMTAMGDETEPHYETFVADIGMKDDGTINFTLAVLPRLEMEEQDEAKP